MNIAHFFIDHPRFATVVNVFIAVFGLAAMMFLLIAQYPNIVPPMTIQITAVYPGRLGGDDRSLRRDAARTGGERRREHGLHQ